MTSRIRLLAGAHVVVAAALVGLGHHAGLLGGVRPLALAVAVVFALVGSVTVQIELGRHACAVTMVEAVLIGALFHLAPVEVAIAATAGEAAACVARRQPVLQLAFNVTGAAAAFTLAALAFAALPGAGSLDGVAWLSALAACGLYGLASHASTSAALSIVEERRFQHVFADSITPSAVATAVSATIGLLGVVLASVNAIAVLLVAPLVALMAVETRRLADHRADHLRFKRLYAASARTSELASRDDAMEMLAREARILVTGAAAICCTVDRAGRWHAIVVSDEGARPALGAEVAGALALREGRTAGEVGGSQVPYGFGGLTAPLESVVFAASGEDAAASVVIAVARNLPGDETSGARAEVLGAFIGHAALTLANAQLFADVEEALAHQLDLNRQKDDFVAAVSHELRTPLTSMIGSMASIARFGDRLAPEKRGVLVDVALRQGDRLKQLIEDLLLLSGIEGRPALARNATAVDLEAMVTDIANDLDGRRNNGPAVEVTFKAGALPPLHSDEGKVRQILVNLVENARKYAPGSPVVVAAEADADRLLIHVTDRGPGIPAHDRERVFERFVQLDQSATRAQGGTGLGLYLCRQLAHALGGTLELAESEAGGCRFTLALPCNTITLSAGEVRLQHAALVGAVPEGTSQ